MEFLSYHTNRTGRLPRFGRQTGTKKTQTYRLTVLDGRSVTKTTVEYLIVHKQAHRHAHSEKPGWICRRAHGRIQGEPTHRVFAADTTRAGSFFQLGCLKKKKGPTKQPSHSCQIIHSNETSPHFSHLPPTKSSSQCRRTHVGARTRTYTSTDTNMQALQ